VAHLHRRGSSEGNGGRIVIFTENDLQAAVIAARKRTGDRDLIVQKKNPLWRVARLVPYTGRGSPFASAITDWMAVDQAIASLNAMGQPKTTPTSNEEARP
jgi:hypothetical protein